MNVRAILNFGSAGVSSGAFAEVVFIGAICPHGVWLVTSCAVRVRRGRQVLLSAPVEVETKRPAPLATLVMRELRREPRADVRNILHCGTRHCRPMSASCK